MRVIAAVERASLWLTAAIGVGIIASIVGFVVPRLPSSCSGFNSVAPRLRLHGKRRSARFGGTTWATTKNFSLRGLIPKVTFMLLLGASLAQSAIVPIGPSPVDVISGVAVGAILSLPDGGFVLTWHGANDDAFAQRFDASAQAIAPPYMINDEFDGIAVAGGHVITKAIVAEGVLLRVVGSDGMSALMTLYDPADRDTSYAETLIFTASQDRLTVAWGTPTGQVFGQDFGVDLTPMGNAFPITEPGIGYFLPYTILRKPDGGLVFSASTYIQGVLGRQLEADNIPAGPTFTVAPDVFAYRTLLCSHSDGGFVIAWEGYSGVSFRRYDSHAQPLTSALNVSIKHLSSIACLPDHGMAIMGSAYLPPIGIAVMFLAFDGDNRPAGQRVISAQIAPGTTIIQALERMTTLADGTFVAAWTVCDDHQIYSPSCHLYMEHDRVSPGRECYGDCDGDAQVTIDEIITAVEMAIKDPLSENDCAMSINCSFDTNLDCNVTIDEIIAAVGAALRGCA